MRDRQIDAYPLGLRLREQLAGRHLIRRMSTNGNPEDKSNPWKRAVSVELITLTNEWINHVSKAAPQIPRHARVTEELFTFSDSSQDTWCSTLGSYQNAVEIR